eukprot:11708_1
MTGAAATLFSFLKHGVERKVRFTLKLIDNDTYKKIFTACASKIIENANTKNINPLKSILAMVTNNKDNIGELKVFLTLNQKRFTQIVTAHTKIVPIVADKIYINIKTTLEQKTKSMTQQIVIMRNVEHIASILKTAGFRSLQKKLSKKNEDLIIKYFLENKIDHNKLFSIDMSSFETEITQYCGDKSIIGAPIKLLTYLQKRLWKQYVKNISDCSKEQIVYLTYHILSNTLQKHQDELPIFTTYFDENNICGSVLVEMNQNDFGTNIVSFTRNNQMKVASMQLFIALISYDLNELNVNATLLSIIRELKSYNHKQMMYLSNIIFKKTDNKRLIHNKELIVLYFERNQINGNKLMNMNKNSFSESVCKFNNNEKLNSPVMILWDMITTFDVHSVNWNAFATNETIQIKASLTPFFEKWKLEKYIDALIAQGLEHMDDLLDFGKEEIREIATEAKMTLEDMKTFSKGFQQHKEQDIKETKEIKDCNHKQILYLLNRVIHESNHKKMNDNKELFVSYF